MKSYSNESDCFYYVVMAERFSPSQILRDLRAGPSSFPPPTAHQVAVAADKYPPRFALVIRQLFYAMSDAVLKTPGRDVISKWVKFTNAWRGQLDSREAKYFLGSVDAYQQATKAGLRELDWNSDQAAQKAARKMAAAAPTENTVEGLAWRVLLGQVQSVYSRDEAAATFLQVRNHPDADLIPAFFRDTGALTYYSEDEVKERRRGLPSLSELRTYDTGATTGTEQAIAIAADPTFFRIYAPMILHSAQQLPTVNFVVLLCARDNELAGLREDAEKYLEGLTALNRQAAPQNVRLIVVSTPKWAANETTFYACSRFLALPGLLEDYESVYAIDADMFMIQDPRPFMTKTAPITFGAPRTEGLLGVSPWRRFMAGNVVANRSYLESRIRARFEDYMSVGLTEPESWMLDQNGIAYAVEGEPGYRPLTTPRPMKVGNFMGQWERNFRVANRQ